MFKLYILVYKTLPSLTGVNASLIFKAPRNFLFQTQLNAILLQRNFQVSQFFQNPQFFFIRNFFKIRNFIFRLTSSYFRKNNF